MSENFYEALSLVGESYAGDASNIWDKPSSAQVVYRFLQFRGIGPKIATMATNILAREYERPAPHTYSEVDRGSLLRAETNRRKGKYRQGATPWMSR